MWRAEPLVHRGLEGRCSIATKAFYGRLFLFVRLLQTSTVTSCFARRIGADERQVACPSSRQVAALLVKCAFKVGKVPSPDCCRICDGEKRRPHPGGSLDRGRCERLFIVGGKMRCRDLCKLGRARRPNMTKRLDDGLGQAARSNQMLIRPRGRCHRARR